VVLRGGRSFALFSPCDGSAPNEVRRPTYEVTPHFQGQVILTVHSVAGTLGGFSQGWMQAVPLCTGSEPVWLKYGKALTVWKGLDRHVTCQQASGKLVGISTSCPSTQHTRYWAASQVVPVISSSDGRRAVSVCLEHQAQGHVMQFMVAS
jgi:hypothetical protein